MVKYQMDRITSAERSAQMSLVKSKDTGPELVVRKLAHSLGYRYRLHGAGLPGKPDLVFSKRKKIVFVHGCFWHRHVACRRATTPATNLEYWLPKFERTVERDLRNIERLAELGWSSLVLWECELKNTGALAEKLMAFLDS